MWDSEWTRSKEQFYFWCTSVTLKTENFPSDFLMFVISSSLREINRHPVNRSSSLRAETPRTFTEPLRPPAEAQINLICRYRCPLGVTSYIVAKRKHAGSFQLLIYYDYWQIYHIFVWYLLPVSLTPKSPQCGIVYVHIYTWNKAYKSVLLSFLIIL